MRSNLPSKFVYKEIWYDLHLDLDQSHSTPLTQKTYPPPSTRNLWLRYSSSDLASRSVECISIMRCIIIPNLGKTKSIKTKSCLSKSTCSKNFDQLHIYQPLSASKNYAFRINPPNPLVAASYLRGSCFEQLVEIVKSLDKTDGWMDRWTDKQNMIRKALLRFFA